ncbi:hypothetical protein LAU_0431 [Lausannevirus]|uniref:Uncharacterized protein n=2 Tax=Lausannevirus TaxID=999883 RepID=A0A0N7G2G8_9VIRU|nr:hypothetical protein LAU_0431 [Lausannevirus]AEA07281.1 hypothetical protein LAU_0431 [Lausannevirus]ALH07088.1 hypothetical protein PMV_390 [Port-miou virus]
MERFLKNNEKISFYVVTQEPEKIKGEFVFEVKGKKFYALKGKYKHRVVSLSETFCMRPDGVSFPHCKKLFVEKCEKNFFFFFVNRRNFPELEELWLNSHPCESNIFFMDIPKIFLVDYYQRYERYGSSPKTVVSRATGKEFSEEKAKYF